MSINRRVFLLSLASIPPLAALPFTALRASAAAGSQSFLAVSETITGAQNLSPETTQRVEQLLRERVDGFDDRLSSLASALSGPGSREALLSALDDEDLDFALQVAKPWYLGYVGSPSGRVLDDDAAFATYLEAQAYQKVADIIPLLSYAPAQAGWWKDVPDGVDGSDLPAGADTWAYQPRQSYQIAAPDPAWRAYAAGDYDTIEEAKADLSGTGKGRADDNTEHNTEHNTKGAS